MYFLGPQDNFRKLQINSFFIYCFALLFDCFCHSISLHLILIISSQSTDDSEDLLKCIFGDSTYLRVFQGHMVLDDGVTCVEDGMISVQFLTTLKQLLSSLLACGTCSITICWYNKMLTRPSCETV